jgi:hypothetical protein
LAVEVGVCNRAALQSLAFAKNASGPEKSLGRGHGWIAVAVNRGWAA